MRGTLTQGDLASWILAGSYMRHQPATHAYEAGVSYSMQRYLGGNGEALAAMRDGSRNVGAVLRDGQLDDHAANCRSATARSMPATTIWLIGD